MFGGLCRRQQGTAVKKETRLQPKKAALSCAFIFLFVEVGQELWGKTIAGPLVWMCRSKSFALSCASIYTDICTYICSYMDLHEPAYP